MTTRVFVPWYALILALTLLIPIRVQGDDETKKPSNGAGSAGTFDSLVKPFLAQYCVSCHGPEKQKGDRRFDSLTGEIPDDDALIALQDILDQLNLGEMPPSEARQPTTEQRRKVTSWLTIHIGEFQQRRKPTADQTVLRRLNTREYRNTIRDLLHVDMTMFDPTLGFPRDQTTEHLDNVGESLVTSGHLLQRYLDAAEKVIEKIFKQSQRPSARTWTFRGGFRQQPEIDQVHGKTNGFSRITLYDVIGADKHEGAYGPIAGFKEGVPVDGFYEIRFQAEAVNRLHPYDIDFVGTDPDEPLRLGIVAGNVRAGPLHKPQPIEPLLSEMDLADERRWYTVRVWLDAGYTPRFTFRNGLMDARNMWGKLVRKYADEFPPRDRGGIVEQRFNAIKYGKLPQIHIHEVQIKGPFFDEWPLASQRAVLGSDWEQAIAAGTLDDGRFRLHLAEFASRAYRRPASDDEVDRLMQLMTTRRKAGRSPLEAYTDALKAVLCSPAFLYLDESGDTSDSADTRLSSHAVASRLSYFLWSSMPDQELVDLAAADKLRDLKVVRAQFQRMLKDPRSSAVIDGLLDSWLTLRDLGSMPPDRSKFEDYYRYDLQSAMREETRLFTRRLVDENLSVINFIDSDFTYLNKALARHYQMVAPSGHEFRLVKIENSRRGGLLGQASVLTVTANGIDTSPVVRGVWLLENILGTPPSPPPPDVPPLDPDVRGATSIREQLAKHRTVSNCYDCHRKIDPLGFALENFDAVGRWRESYGGKARIDATGELPSGHKFDDVEGFKKILVERKEQFITALTTKILAYGTGRRTSPGDRMQVQQLVKEVDQRGNGLRDLLELIATCDAFRSQ